MKRLILILLTTALTLSMTVGASSSPAAREYATVQDALAILRHVVGLPSTAAVESHNFSGSGEIEVRDALLVLRGLVGLGEPRVVGVRNILPTLPECPDEPLSDAMIARILQDEYEWWYPNARERRPPTSEQMSNMRRQFIHLGTYGDSVVFEHQAGVHHGAWTTRTIAEHVFAFSDVLRIYVWNGGKIYELNEWIMPPLGDYINGERVTDWFGRFEEVYGHYPTGTVMPGAYELGLLTQDDMAEIHARFVQALRERSPVIANYYYGEN